MKFILIIISIIVLITVPMYLFVRNISGKSKSKKKVEQKEEAKPKTLKQEFKSRKETFFRKEEEKPVTSFNSCTIAGVFYHPAYGKTFLLSDGQWIYKGAVTALGFVRDLYFNYFRVFDHEGIEHFYYHQDKAEVVSREVAQ